MIKNSFCAVPRNSNLYISYLLSTLFIPLAKSSQRQKSKSVTTDHSSVNDIWRHPVTLGKKVINNISPISSFPVQVFTDDAAGTEDMWKEKEAKGNCLLPINQCSALLPRSKGSAGRSMQSDKPMVFWCWHHTCININLLAGLCIPIARLSTGPNQSSLLWSIKIYDYNTSVHSAAEGFWICWQGI